MRWWLIGLLLAPFVAHAEPCCGAITPQGRELARLLDGSGVDHLWVAGRHVDWRTGDVNRRHHPGAWLPGGGGTLRYYAHAVDWR